MRKAVGDHLTKIATSQIKAPIDLPVYRLEAVSEHSLLPLHLLSDRSTWKELGHSAVA